MKSEIFYHFTNDLLRDGKPIPPIGELLEFPGLPVPCVRGLHASAEPFDALQYAPGERLHQVHLAGDLQSHGNPVDKYVAKRRKIVATIDSTTVLRQFARRVALDVVSAWAAPPVVLDFLNGDDSKRSAAESAAGSAAGSAAWSAAWSAKQDLYRQWFNEMVVAAFVARKAAR
jgi:hypothetical protein